MLAWIHAVDSNSGMEMVLRYACLRGEHLKRASRRIEYTKSTLSASVIFNASKGRKRPKADVSLPFHPRSVGPHQPSLR